MYSESNKNGRKVVQKSSDQHVLAIVHTLLHMFVYMCVHMYDFCKTTKICLSVCMFFMCAVCAIVWLALRSHRISHLKGEFIAIHPLAERNVVQWLQRIFSSCCSCTHAYIQCIIVGGCCNAPIVIINVALAAILCRKVTLVVGPGTAN